ncbi:MAG: tetratricopeptide repeat protein [Saprospiraceae bacterium]|nr:tetratricopeptide repeat protein [Saprospiraceae bacterium]
MKKLILSLCSMLLVLTLVAQTKQKTPNGWEYTVLKEGKGKNITREGAIEFHIRMVNAENTELQSSYDFAPNYSVTSSVPDSLRITSEAMAEGGKYAIFVPNSFLKSQSPDMPLTGEFTILEMEILRVLPPYPPITDIISKTLQNDGADAAFAQFNTIINDKNRQVYIGETAINDAGYMLLEAKKTQEAISIFKYNVKMNPNSANAYDSLGEALAAAGEKKAAIDNYKKSLELNPKNENAKKMIADLEKQ